MIKKVNEPLKTIFYFRHYAFMLSKANFRIEKKTSLKKTKYNILTFTLPCCRLRTPTSLLICVQFISQWVATQIWWLWRRYKHQTKFREFIYKEMLTFDFNNFMWIISLYRIILKFVQIPWPDADMNKSMQRILNWVRR